MKKNIQSLNGLRGLAAMMVVLAHMGGGPLFFDIKFAGQLGVMLFFGLSGFLMAYLYSNETIDFQMIKSYFIRRFFRVYPAYLLMISIAYVSYSFLDYSLFHGGGKQEFILSEYLAHAILQRGFNIFWTIPVEMKFYLIFPLIMYILFITQKENRIGLLSILFVIFVTVDMKGPNYSLWPKVEFFIAGMLAAFFYNYRDGLPNPIKRSKRWDWVLLICLLMIFISIPRFFEAIFNVSHDLWGDSFVFAPLMAFTVFSAAMSDGFLSNVILANPIAVFFGKVSFSLYLVHHPIIQGINRIVQLKKIEIFTPLLSLIVIGVSLLVAYGMYSLIENPIRKFGNKLAKK